jgi:pyrimidine-nucleoside phosphorylase
MRAYDIIKKKRDNETLRRAEIDFIINGFTEGTIADYQMAAFAMTIFQNGLDGEELAAFTSAMLHSGEVLELNEVPAVKVDKHSTGGVGDKISLPLAPAVAACGVPVPMISGRGLGHTGGTLDKLESIPGFRVDLSTDDYRRLVRDVGCCLIGQTAEVAPADKKLYALRDVTATVDCIPLIVSSILSKKLAEGIDALVLDVKFGSGAFMKSKADAEILARTMVDIGTRMGKNVVARMTNMDQPLGRMVGNALEVHESLDVLEGQGPDDVRELTVELGAEMLCMGGVTSDQNAGREKIKEVLGNGAALEKFGEIIRAQGGDDKVIEDRSKLQVAEKRLRVIAEQSGYIHSIDAERVGVASLLLGGGRARKEDSIDPSVGVEVMSRIGDFVEKGQELFLMYSSGRGEDAAKERLVSSVHIGADKIEGPALLGRRIDEGILK